MINSVNFFSVNTKNNYQKTSLSSHQNINFKSNEGADVIQADNDKKQSFLSNVGNLFAELYGEMRIVSPRSKLNHYCKKVYSDYFEQMKDIKKNGIDVSIDAVFRDILPNIDSHVTPTGRDLSGQKAFYTVHHEGQDFSRFMKFDEDGRKYFEARVNRQDNSFNYAAYVQAQPEHVLEFTTPDRSVLIDKKFNSIHEKNFKDGKLVSESFIYLDSCEKLTIKCLDDNQKVVQQRSKIAIIPKGFDYEIKESLINEFY